MKAKGWIAVAGIALALALWWSQPAGAQEAPPTPSETCLVCHAQEGLEMVLPSGQELSITVNEEALNASVHGQLAADITCQACHTDISGYPHGELPLQDFRDLQIYYGQTCANCHEDEAMRQVDNVHAHVMAAGVREAATCVDCHGSHQVQPIDRQKHPEVSATASVEMCFHCHSGIYDKFRNSVHGQPLFADSPDVPNCVSCHPAHTAEDPRTLEFRLMSPQLCANCHADKALMTKYGISTEVFDTYVSDFHGTTVVLFEKIAPDQPTNKAVCTDCHGAHAIEAASIEDLALKANLVETCRPCHPDATVNFASSWLGHYSPDWQRYPIITAVTWFYRILIPGLIGFFLVYIGLDVQRRIRQRLRSRGAQP